MTESYIFTTDIFTKDEMLLLTRAQLIKILDYLEIMYDPKYTKARLIDILSNYQVSKRLARLSSEETPETPRYSVRVKAIMERMEKERNDP